MTEQTEFHEEKYIFDAYHFSETPCIFLKNFRLHPVWLSISPSWKNPQILQVKRNRVSRHRSKTLYIFFYSFMKLMELFTIPKFAWISIILNALSIELRTNFDFEVFFDFTRQIMKLNWCKPQKIIWHNFWSNQVNFYIEHFNMLQLWVLYYQTLFSLFRTFRNPFNHMNMDCLKTIQLYMFNNAEPW